MRELTDRALNLAKTQGVTYADMRIVRRDRQDINVKNGVVQTLSLDSDQGFGVRVIADTPPEVQVMLLRVLETGEIAPVERQHFTVRSRHWRYCLWANGEEELYDHRSDPRETRNLAGHSELASEMEELAGQLGTVFP